MVDHWAGLSIFLGALGTVPHKCLRAENKININEIKSNINEIKINIDMRSLDDQLIVFQNVKPVQLRVNCPRAEIILKVAVSELTTSLNISLLVKFVKYSLITC